jgi:hypothetical protein
MVVSRYSYAQLESITTVWCKRILFVLQCLDFCMLQVPACFGVLFSFLIGNHFGDMHFRNNAG